LCEKGFYWRDGKSLVRGKKEPKKAEGQVDGKGKKQRGNLGGGRGEFGAPWLGVDFGRAEGKATRGNTAKKETERGKGLVKDPAADEWGYILREGI